MLWLVKYKNDSYHLSAPRNEEVKSGKYPLMSHSAATSETISIVKGDRRDILDATALR